jgi:hypothetical protein
VETDFRGLVEFTNRQILITRVYAQKIWVTAAATHFLYCLTITVGIGLAIGDALTQFPALHIAALTFFILLLSAIRASLRVVAVTEILSGARAQILSQSWVYILLTCLVPFWYVFNFACSLISRKIRWRNVEYELISPNQTRILTP